MTRLDNIRDHVCFPIVTDEAPNHAALSLTLCRICLEPMDYQVHTPVPAAPQRIQIAEDEPECVLA